MALETLIDRAVTRTGYDRHLLALPGGERRMANVRKLMRMAREYEADEGRDLRGFIDAVAERDVLQAREGEAPLEAEALDAVRLMTIHRAKGLEFPVVCVADLGKDGREDDGALRISDDGTHRPAAGVELGGRRELDAPARRGSRPSRRSAAEEEERRIFYVAATRAEEHLILSGATDLEKLPEPDDLCGADALGLARLLRRAARGGASGVHVDEREGREVRVRWRRLTPATLDELLPPADRAPARPARRPQAGTSRPSSSSAPLPAPRALPVSRLSYSGLEAYRRCSYRFYLERALRLPTASSRRPRGRRGRPSRGLSALLRGTSCTSCSSELDFERPLVPDAEARWPR